MTTKILIAEDEEDIRELIHFNLFKEGYEVATATNGEEAWNLMQKQEFDLALLDIMMPKLDGITLCGKIRDESKFSHLGLVMVTAKGGEEDVVRGLDAGADDYITKPFRPKELVARVKSVLRRMSKPVDTNQDIVKVFDIEINRPKRVVQIEKQEVELTYSEFELLLLLSQRPGWVFTRSQIVNSIQGENHCITDRSVDVHVVSLRKKMGESGKLIETVRGVGYRFKAP